LVLLIIPVAGELDRLLAGLGNSLPLDRFFPNVQFALVCIYC